MSQSQFSVETPGQLSVEINRRIISKVVVEPSADDKSADLAIHGHLAAIMAADLRPNLPPVFGRVLGL
jgi:hypothetical protein